MLDLTSWCIEFPNIPKSGSFNVWYGGSKCWFGTRWWVDVGLCEKYPIVTCLSNVFSCFFHLNFHFGVYHGLFHFQTNPHTTWVTYWLILVTIGCSVIFIYIYMYSIPLYPDYMLNANISQHQGHTVLDLLHRWVQTFWFTVVIRLYITPF